MIREAGLYDKISQAYAALDPSKAVGVMVRLVAFFKWFHSNPFTG
jgi:GMP synthase PP-ATPase subunit